MLQFATEEADRLLHNYIGPEHLLLGILHEERSVAGSLLRDKGLRLNSVREQIATLKNPLPSMDVDQLARLAEENAGLRAIIQQLQQEHEPPLEFHENAYWLHRTGRPPEGPYCSTCWDIERRLVRKLTAVSGDVYCEYCTNRREKH